MMVPGDLKKSRRSQVERRHSDLHDRKSGQKIRAQGRRTDSNRAVDLGLR
jgi:hypothetical protein